MFLHPKKFFERIAQAKAQVRILPLGVAASQLDRDCGDFCEGFGKNLQQFVATVSRCVSIAANRHFAPGGCAVSRPAAQLGCGAMIISDGELRVHVGRRLYHLDAPTRGRLASATSAS